MRQHRGKGAAYGDTMKPMARGHAPNGSAEERILYFPAQGGIDEPGVALVDELTASGDMRVNRRLRNELFTRGRIGHGNVDPKAHAGRLFLDVVIHDGSCLARGSCEQRRARYSRTAAGSDKVKPLVHTQLHQ